jgi:hypothetical protein
MKRVLIVKESLKNSVIHLWTPKAVEVRQNSWPMAFARAETQQLQPSTSAF